MTVKANYRNYKFVNYIKSSSKLSFFNAIQGKRNIHPLRTEQGVMNVQKSKRKHIIYCSKDFSKLNLVNNVLTVLNLLGDHSSNGNRIN